jgi:hypothetical protein
MPKQRKRSEDVEASPDPAPDTRAEELVGTTGRVTADNHSNYADRVALRAYELYLARGGSDGRDFDDWLAAERELGLKS